MRRAFTLVELIAVIVVLAILAGVAVPRYFDYAQRARVSMVVANLAAVGSALRMYTYAYNAYPPNWGTAGCPPGFERLLDPSMFTQATPVGGAYDFENWDATHPRCASPAQARTPRRHPTLPP
jgi:prepilin-type N-terminal cleavage/methylation domain-containing protein